VRPEEGQGISSHAETQRRGENLKAVSHAIPIWIGTTLATGEAQRLTRRRAGRKEDWSPETGEKHRKTCPQIPQITPITAKQKRNRRNFVSRHPDPDRDHGAKGGRLQA
jgi:hypothetical protein